MSIVKFVLKRKTKTNVLGLIRLSSKRDIDPKLDLKNTNNNLRGFENYFTVNKPKDLTKQNIGEGFDEDSSQDWPDIRRFEFI